MPRFRRRGRHADREHLRRRAADLPADRRTGAAASSSAASTSTSAPTACSSTKKLHQFRPTSRFFFNVHLDGLEKTHDIAVEREGVFQAAVEGIKAAKKAGFLVCTNTTVYKETDMAEIDALTPTSPSSASTASCSRPAYGYAAVCSTNPDGAAEIFLTRDEIKKKFNEAARLFKKYKMNTSPVYLEFLQGKRDLTCAALGQPDPEREGLEGPVLPHHRRTPRDLRRPDERHRLGEYGYGKDPRCEHCMMHSGYEVAAALGVNARLGDSLKMLRWQLT